MDVGRETGELFLNEEHSCESSTCLSKGVQMGKQQGSNDLPKKFASRIHFDFMLESPISGKLVLQGGVGMHGDT